MKSPDKCKCKCKSAYNCSYPYSYATKIHYACIFLLAVALRPACGQESLSTRAQKGRKMQGSLGFPIDFWPPLSIDQMRPKSSASPSISAIPTFQPSQSNIPTLSSPPSSTPSLQPSTSTTPSTSPTIPPSANPSAKPSESARPSMAPSATPSVSLVPSSSPTSRPSLVPSASLVPSSSPSSPPSLSIQPSDSPSDSPSQFPTNSQNPTGPPSPAPMITSPPTITSPPSMDPSDFPTDTPSNPPSISDKPSESPSESPTNTPTASPSAHPTVVPSVEPSPAPTDFPSEYPSDHPSSSPSAAPSSSPSLTCHDQAAYRSPINDLTCEDHKGTDCVRWRALGLNTTELGRLINTCPETCNIPCGSFTQYSISVSYHISSIPGLLDSASKLTLEETSFSFLLAYVRSKHPKVDFELDKVELTSQSIYEPPDSRLLLRRSRSLQKKSAVEVSILFDGFTIGMTSNKVSELLVSGIDNPAYTIALQNSDEFYSTAVISSASEVDYVISGNRDDLEDDGRAGASIATVVVVTLVSVSVFAFVIGAFVYHRQSGNWVPQLKLPSSLRYIDERDINDSGSPRHIMPPSSYLSQQSASPRNNMISQAGAMLSFDESRTNAGNNNVNTTAANSNGNPLNRLIASLSLNSRSSPSTEADDSDSPRSGSTHKKKHPTIGPIVSPMSDGSEASVSREHPLANVIPPMIVIDHIDSHDKNSNANTKTNANVNDNKASKAARKNQQVPSRRVEASSAFITVLSDRTNPHQSKNFSGMLYNGSDFGGELNLSLWSNAEDTNRVLSPLGIQVDSDSDDDDDDDDETSVASTPVHSKAQTATSLRRTVSSSALESLERRTGPPSLLLPDGFALESPEFSISENNEHVSNRKWSIPSHEGDGDSCVSLEFGPEPLPPIESRAMPTSSSDWQQLPPVHPPTPEKSSRTTGSPSAAKRNSVWSLSPIAKARTFKRPSLPKKGDFSRKSSSYEASEHSEDDHATSHSSPSHPDNVPVDICTRHEFKTSRKGQLGLVIESSTKTGPVVHAVKDYSPLFGLVKKGDQIVEVDGKNTSQNTLSEITRLLAVKPGRRGSNSSIRMVVSRSKGRNEDGPKSAASHTRDSSHGSSSIASSRMLEDVDALTVDVESQADDLRNSFYSDQSTEKGEL